MACPDDTFWSVPFGVSFLYMAWRRFLCWVFFNWCISFRSNQNEKNVSNAKTWSLMRFLHNLKGHKNIHQFINYQFHQFYLNYIRKGGAFHGLLYPHNFARLIKNEFLATRNLSKHSQSHGFCASKNDKTFWTRLFQWGYVLRRTNIQSDKYCWVMNSPYLKKEKKE